MSVPVEYNKVPARRWVIAEQGAGFGDMNLEPFGNTTVAAVMLMEPEGDWLWAPLAPASPVLPTPATATVPLANFTAVRIGVAACDALLLSTPSTALPVWLGGGVGIAVCVESASG